MDEPVASEEPLPPVERSGERRSSGTPVRASAAWAAKRSELCAARQRLKDAQHGTGEGTRSASKGSAPDGDVHLPLQSADQAALGPDSPAGHTAAASKQTSSPGTPQVLTFSVADVKGLGFGTQANQRAAERQADAARVAATHRAPLRLAFEAARKQSGGAPVETKKTVVASGPTPPPATASPAPATPHRPVAVAALRPPRVSGHLHARAPAPPSRPHAAPSARPSTADATMRPRRIGAPSPPAHPPGASGALAHIPVLPRARRASTTGVVPRVEDPNDAVTRTNFDKRTCRRTHAVEFAAAIALWRRQRGLPTQTEPGGASPPAADIAAPADVALGGHSSRHALPHARICLRKRPLFPADTARGEYDAVTIPKPAACVVHVCSMRPDLRRMFIRNVTCSISAGGGSCFGEGASDQEVYASACAPLVAAALEGSPAAVFMFGQTGSGKTHTMGAFQRLAAERLLPAAGAGDARVKSVVIEYFEIAGKTARDLLVVAQPRSSSGEAASGGDEHPGMILVRDAPTSSAGVELVGATSRAVTSAAQLLDVIAEGTSRRATRATAMNADSSRSHAVLRLHLMDAHGRATGSLTMVDCAGSERKEDSFAHDAAQRKEGAYINASLYALKECMRARAKAASAPQKPAAAGAAHVHVPYRSSLLTRVLAECLTCSHAALCVVGTLSPDASDAEHSISTMQAVSLLAAGDVAGHVTFSEANDDVAPGLTMDDVMADGPLSNPGKLSAEALAMQRVQRIPPVQWKPADLCTWLRRTHNGAFAGVAGSVPQWMAGRDVARMSAAAMTATLCGGDAKLAEKLHVAFRDAVTRAAAAKAGKA